MLCDDPSPEVNTVPALATSAAARSLITDDFEHARAIATFDEEVFTLALLPVVRECADSAAYVREALACLAKSQAKIVEIHREAQADLYLGPRDPGNARFLDMRNTEHMAVAARRLQRVQARVREEEADLAIAAVHLVMKGQGTAHDLQEAAAGWRVSADQGDAGAQLLIGALYACGGGGVKRRLPLGKHYLELSAAAGNEAAVALLKELRKCVGCGELDVHHMICSQCRDARNCDDDCQLRHWQCPTHPHKPHCVPRRDAAAAGGSSSERADPSSDHNQRSVEVTAAAAVTTAQSRGG